MRTTRTNTTSIHKVRRRVCGGKRPKTYRRQPIRRADPCRIHAGEPDATLTGVAGLASFGVFCAREGINSDLKPFDRLKDKASVIYPMATQLRLLLDANIAGESRVFGLESLASDPLFLRLAGGAVPSIDTVYRDLRRFDEDALRDLEAMMGRQGIVAIKHLGLKEVHVDIDTTVECVFGTQQDARPGPNPRYAGRPSFHPMLAYCAEAGVCVGAILRPGDTNIGAEDAPAMGSWLRRLRDKLAHTLITARIDAGGDCADVLATFQRVGVRFIAKARMQAPIRNAIYRVKRWRTVDEDASGNPTRQVAEVDYQRPRWSKLGHRFRIVAVRTRDRDAGTLQGKLWDEYSVQAYITNDMNGDIDDIAHEYNGRAEVEPAIAELKYGWGIGKIPSDVFCANQALFILKLLAHNLMRRFVKWVAPQLVKWRSPWLRRALINIPGRLIRSGRQWSLRVAPHSLVRLE
jgi:hypothetical protein